MWFTGIWEKRNDETYENIWRADFQMSPDTFCAIIELVPNSLEKQDTQFCKAIIGGNLGIFILRPYMTKGSCVVLQSILKQKKWRF